MIKIAICDDDRNIINEIKNCIESYQGLEYSITTYGSGEELLEASEKFDLIFLDIDMTGINGIETAKEIRNYDKAVKIIYVTSYTDYLNLAFSVHAFGYLNKPVKMEQIHSQLDEVLSYSMEEKEEVLEFITTEGVVRLTAKEIYYFEYINRTVKLKTLKESYILRDKITRIANEMEEYGFLMPHKSFTVNLFHVKSIKGYDIFMMDGSIIPLSQKKSTEFRDEFNMFLEKRILQ
ncbi:LytR/AlgR family response regulator transcription factor [Clostridium sp. LP20]|uniref:LytR/AlgR family response regulator transcription factor n=1 Tax=Clostridium sp. LP20 TaxID=3418665 RepID=UPI003EE6FB96